MNIDFAAAVVFVKEINASRNFYENILGMKVKMDNGPNILYEGGLSFWQEDRALSIIYGSLEKGNAPLGRNNLELYFETDDLPGVAARMEQQGISLIQDIHEEPWGQRSFRLKDPDGHLIEIAEPMTAVVKKLKGKGMSVLKISEKTGMSVETVRNMLNTLMDDNR